MERAEKRFFYSKLFSASLLTKWKSAPPLQNTFFTPEPLERMGLSRVPY